jgi:hypothetical protein
LIVLPLVVTFTVEREHSVVRILNIRCARRREG